MTTGRLGWVVLVAAGVAAGCGSTPPLPGCATGSQHCSDAASDVAAADAPELRAHILLQFTGPAYGWMWPFPKAVNRWFDEALADVRAELGA